MTGLTINTAANTIEMTKTFAKDAKYFGSEAYKMLQAARKDYPTYAVVTKKAAKKENYKGLTIAYMKKYIEAHPLTLLREDNSEVKAIEVFNGLIARDNNGTKIDDCDAAYYGEIRKWFFNCYPEVKNRKEKINKLLATTTKKPESAANRTEEKVVNMKASA